MELRRALELYTEYNGVPGVVKCIGDYICLNDLNSYFPSKRIDHWLESTQVKELIEGVEKNIIPGKPGIQTRRGKGGGTYAHHLIAMDFAAWLSVEFKLRIYLAYSNGTQHKQNWDFKRVLAADNYRLMCRAIEDHNDPAKVYHFSNEALMLNEIVFGIREGDVRDGATEQQLDDISWLESRNGAYIELGMDYQTRKKTLIEMYAKKNTKLIENN